MGISIDRAIRLKKEAISKIISLDSQSRIYGLPHETILAEMAKIRAGMVKAPAWAKTYVQGYFDALTQAQWQNDLVYCHVAPDGTRYTMASNRPVWAEDVNLLYADHRGAEIATWKHAHFWRNGRPFVEPKTSIESDAEYAASKVKVT